MQNNNIKTTIDQNKESIHAKCKITISTTIICLKSILKISYSNMLFKLCDVIALANFLRHLPSYNTCEDTKTRLLYALSSSMLYRYAYIMCTIHVITIPIWNSISLAVIQLANYY